MGVPEIGTENWNSQPSPPRSWESSLRPVHKKMENCVYRLIVGAGWVYFSTCFTIGDLGKKSNLCTYNVNELIFWGVDCFQYKPVGAAPRKQ
jgi:hypothetical protein